MMSPLIGEAIRSCPEVSGVTLRDLPFARDRASQIAGQATPNQALACAGSTIQTDEDAGGDQSVACHGAGSRAAAPDMQPSIAPDARFLRACDAVPRERIERARPLKDA
ncbi:MAG: hypothetical protein ACREEL_12775 [Stellaceae bacterium]